MGTAGCECTRRPPFSEPKPACALHSWQPAGNGPDASRGMTELSRARSSLLHTATARSRLSRRGQRDEPAGRYRTSARLVASYTAGEVARVLAEDFARHGPPLAMRMDRASQHDAGPVRELLRRHEMLILHGPARYPQYYGQHERQNREHQAWLAYSDGVNDAELQEMLRVLNQRWLRPSLDWRSSAALWEARRTMLTQPSRAPPRRHPPSGPAAREKMCTKTG